MRKASRITRVKRSPGRKLTPRQKRELAALAALGLVVSMFLPWYSKTFVERGAAKAAQTSLSAFQDFSFVEAAVLLVSAGVLALLFARAERQRFQLPTGDGLIVMQHVARIIDRRQPTLRHLRQSAPHTGQVVGGGLAFRQNFSPMLREEQRLLTYEPRIIALQPIGDRAEIRITLEVGWIGERVQPTREFLRRELRGFCRDPEAFERNQ